MLLKSSNILKAEVVNRFLYMLNNPEGTQFQDPLNPHFRAEICKCLESQIKQSAKDNSIIQEALDDAGRAFTAAFISAVIDKNKRTIPYLEDDVEFANTSDMDILCCPCSEDTRMHPLSNNEISTKGYNII